MGAETRWEAISVTQVVQTGVRGSNGGGKKQSDSEHNLKVEAQGLLDVQCERKGKGGFSIKCDGMGYRSSSFGWGWVEKIKSPTFRHTY